MNHLVLWRLTSKTDAKIQIKFVTCKFCKKFNFVSECFLLLVLCFVENFNLFCLLEAKM